LQKNIENQLGADGDLGNGELTCMCCGGWCLMPNSVASKLANRGGIYKFVGDFGMRENIYYGSIFLCMTLIVVCFIVISHRMGWPGSSAAGSAAAFYDIGNQESYFFSN